MICSLLETLDHDIAVVAGDFVLCFDARAIAQHIEARCRLFLGEWFLDTREGAPWWTTVFIKNPDVSLIRSMLSQIVLDTPGVKSLTEAKFRFDSAERILYYSIVALTVTNETVAIDNAFVVGDL